MSCTSVISSTRVIFTYKGKNFVTYNFSKAVNPKKLAAAKTPTTSASLTFISHSFSYSAERARAKAAK